MNWNMSLSELVAGTEGQLVSQSMREFNGVGTDTRQNLQGKIFFALKGDTFDAHDFLQKAVDNGAAALVVQGAPNGIEALSKLVTIVHVEDTLKAIQLLAGFWRHKMRARILGVTGTNGKTTTKEFTAAIIGSQKRVQYSKGSFNNHWGVPISLLSIEPEHQVAVIEMGMNHLGELKTLSEIVEADSVLCTMVGRGHLEGVGSIEGVAHAKSEIYEFAQPNATRIFNLENEYTAKMFETFGRKLPKDRVLTFAGFDFAKKNKLKVDVALEVVSVEPDALVIRGEIKDVSGEARVSVFGRQNVTNLMAASCFALDVGLLPDQIWSALPLCKSAWGRNQWVKLESGARLLFDAYNANPESMKAAVENFAQIQKVKGGRKIAVLAEMRELGTHASELHRELGMSVAQAGFDEVCFIGPSANEFALGLKAGGFNKKPIISNTYEQKLAQSGLPVLDEKDFVLMKGSRGMHLEKVLAEFKPLDFDSKKS